MWVRFSVVVIERNGEGTKATYIDNIYPIYDTLCETIEFIKDKEIVQTFRADSVESMTILFSEVNYGMD